MLSTPCFGVNQRGLPFGNPLVFLLERETGFEPATSCLGSCLETSHQALGEPTACLLSRDIFYLARAGVSSWVFGHHGHLFAVMSGAHGTSTMLPLWAKQF